MDKSGMTPSTFADYININRTTISHILSGRNKKPSIDVVMQILEKYPEINSDWLIFGKGPMNKSEKPVLEMKNLFDNETVNPPKNTNVSKHVKDTMEKQGDVLPKSTKNQTLIGEMSMTENIDKIVIFFKNKTYITLKPEE